MGSYVWYTTILACGHTVDWNEFRPQPPVVGKGAWCEYCRSNQTVVDVKRHVTHEDEEEMEYE